MIRYSVVLLWCYWTLQSAAAAPPNFIVIVADDLGATDCQPMGNAQVRTPNLSRLAAAGLTFDQAFLTCSSCSPSRSSILTGRYPHQTDAEQLHWPLPAEQTTFAELLQQQGYFTAAAGKWHLGAAAKRGFAQVEEASSQGFQLQVGAGDQAPPMVDANNASGCAGWVSLLASRPQDKPFFLWLAALDPHRDYAAGIVNPPHSAAAAVIPPYLPETDAVRQDFAAYYDEITRLDSYVGAVLDEVDRQGIAAETYVIFMSDNGRPFPRCKTTLFDSGVQTPLIVRCPGKVPQQQRTSALVSSIDLSATILELAGVEVPATVQGKSFVPVLVAPQSEHRQTVFSEHNWHDYDAYQRSVRSKRYKYIRNFDHNLSLTPPADAVRSATFVEMRRLRDAGELTEQQQQCFVSPRSLEELYDLQADPHELNNLVARPELQEVLAEHRRQLDAWRIETDDIARTLRSADEFDRETGLALANRQRPRLGKQDGFQPLFNGRDLSGWRRTNSAESTWQLQEDLLVCSGRPIGELRTEKMYQNFVLELEWRHLVPGGNAGIFLWADDITAKGVPFHRGIEVQVLENAYGQSQHHTTHGDIFPIHGARMIPVHGRGGDRAFPTQNLSRPSPEWNHYRIVANQGEVSLAVNGTIVTRGIACNPQRGYLCLESEGGVVHYRNVRLKELPDTPIEPQAIAQAERGYLTLYDGLGLSGWEVSEGTNWKSQDWILAHRPEVTSATEAGTLRTQQSYRDARFIVDIKRPNTASQLLLQFRDLQLDTRDDVWAEQLSKPGNWDRLELARIDRRLQVSINGKLVIDQEVDQAADELHQNERGPLLLKASGDWDFANLYVSESQP